MQKLLISGSINLQGKSTLILKKLEITTNITNGEYVFSFLQHELFIIKVKFIILAF